MTTLKKLIVMLYSFRTNRKIFLIIVWFLSLNCFSREINILEFGAVPDGRTINTHKIQSAINQIFSEGGGNVVIPAGNFLTGTLYLKDNVGLRFEAGSVLLGSTDPQDYPENDLRVVNGEGKALVYANGQKNISITGRGIINGFGNSPIWTKGDNAANRPKILQFVDCRNVVVEGITLTNSAEWVSFFLACEYVKIDGIKIYSYGNYNNDGIDIDSKNVVISNCIIESDDDALCFKSHIHDRPCEDISVTNCIIASNCNGIKFGTASHGGFRNITVSNCIVRRPVEDNLRSWQKHIEGIDSARTVISGIALEMVDGGIMDQVSISDIVMEGVQTPIFIKLGDRTRYNNQAGQLKNIMINNILAHTTSLISSSITGYPNHHIQNVTISNVNIIYKGGGTDKHYRSIVPENEKMYPENRMFGNYLPAYGFFIRHIDGLTMQNINLSLSQPDARSVIRLENASDVVINGLKADIPSSKVSIIEIIRGRSITISKPILNNKYSSLLSVSKDSQNVNLIGTNFRER